jgi:hypothetical protein
MVMIKKAKKKESGAPIISLSQAKVQLSDIEFHAEPHEVEKKDGSTFTADPGLNVKVTIVDDLADGKYDDASFFQNFRMKWNDEKEHWEMRDGTGLGGLLRARYGHDYYDFDGADTPEEFDPSDFDGFEFLTKIVPKKNPSTKQICGSMCHHETIMAIPDPKRKKKKLSVKEAQAEASTAAEINELSHADEKLMHESLG